MLRTTQILVPLCILSLTTLGLSVIYNGGTMEVQWGADKLIRIESLQPNEVKDITRTYALTK